MVGSDQPDFTDDLVVFGGSGRQVSLLEYIERIDST
jgi:hypothetical protein